MPINHRRGPCRYCGKPVGRRKGHASRSAATGVWLAWHGRCDPAAHPGGRAGVSSRKPPPDPPARRPYCADDDE